MSVEADGEAFEVTAEIEMSLTMDLEERAITADVTMDMQTTGKMDMEMETEDFGMPEEEGKMTIDMFMTMLAYNYNQPVSIVLPPEAEDAEEFPMLMP